MNEYFPEPGTFGRWVKVKSNLSYYAKADLKYATGVADTSKFP